MDPNCIFNTAHPLTNFKMQKQHQDEPKFVELYSRDNLPNKSENGTYVIYLDDYFDIGTHWIALYSSNNYVLYFGSFGVEHIPNKIKNLFSIKRYKRIFIEYKHRIQ